ncbi:ABC transporter ATP-binding protein [Desulfitibacter alkalitolerans]|uniref:ABC transporter ATP-binding protein n=1 Tax=Desulfitibacter alkalitolerans TaxID=264641 RepID=UPI000483EBF3|nr:ABC transporter ATP-binding protein [Desulfitibacter alkalitolerans]
MPQYPLVEMKSITKRFPGVVANDKVNFEAKAGEIHALLGENGAGKSTLMSILTGLYAQDEGEILIKGQPVRINSPREAIDHGIGMVHQHFRLVQPFTVAENIILGKKGVGLFIDKDKLEKEIEDLSKRFALKVEPKARIWQLSVGEQQRVEIIKMLYRGADILILDEPTAVLTPQEVRELFRTLKQMALEGKAVILITHKLNEVMDIADKITVLRGGKSVATVNKVDTNKKELTKLMVGREVMLQVDKKPVQEGPVVLDLQNVSCLSDKGYPALKDVHLQIKGGEILGIAGVAGNGQRELAEVITGLRKVTKGLIKIENKDYTNASPRDIIEARVAYIPEDRVGMGLVPSLCCVENTILKNYREKPVCRSLFIDNKYAKERAAKLVRDFNVKTAGIEKPVKLMSGGNLQKLLFAREISCEPRLIVAVYPVRGLDVSAIEAVHDILLEQRGLGTAILFISEDLDEIFKMSDTIAVMHEGTIMGVMPAHETNVEEVGMLMAGTKLKQEEVI